MIYVVEILFKTLEVIWNHTVE